jgi:hypothetical protein
MPPVLDWESRVGRRLRLRDLHILFAVVEHGSMSAAGVHPICHSPPSRRQSPHLRTR